MKKSLIISAAIAVVALSSCTTTKNSSYTTTPETMVVNMTVADIQVDEQPVTTTTTWKWNPFRRVKDYKKNAEATALRMTGADVLVNPYYEVKTNGFLRGGSVTVTGHPGTYVNYRNLTEKDAEIINTLKGRLGVATPMVTTTAPSFIDRLRPKKQPKAPKVRKPVSNDLINKSFGQVLFGGGGGDCVTNDFTLGLMYGKFKQKWGWYGKVNIEWGKRGEDSKTAFNVTGGVVKTLPRHFSLFAGAGFGPSLGKGLDIPVDLGVQWNYKRFLVSFSLQAALNTKEFGTYTSFNAFGGIGYVF